MPSPGLENIQVCDLFILGHANWDVELINAIFNYRDAKKTIEYPFI